MQPFYIPEGGQERGQLGRAPRRRRRLTDIPVTPPPAGSPAPHLPGLSSGSCGPETPPSSYISPRDRPPTLLRDVLSAFYIYIHDHILGFSGCAARTGPPARINRSAPKGHPVGPRPASRPPQLRRPNAPPRTGRKRALITHQGRPHPPRPLGGTGSNGGSHSTAAATFRVGWRQKLRSS
jgi:hypothetical protein